MLANPPRMFMFATVKRHSLALTGIFTLACGVLTPAVAGAQVNSERIRVGKIEDGFHASIDGALTVKAGNVDYVSLTAATRVEYKKGIHTPFVVGNVAFAENAGETIISNGFAHLRWTAMWHERVGSEIFLQLQFNKFTALQLRQLVGAGARFVLYDGERFEAFAGTGYMIEHERLDREQIGIFDPADPRYHPLRPINHRSTSYFSFRAQLTENTHVNNTIFFQPRVDRFSDLRLLNEVGLEVSLTEYVSLLVGAVYLYDSDPPFTIKRSDLTSINRVRVTF